MNSYLWIGNCADDYLKNRIISNGGKIMSSCVSQDSLLNGIESTGIICDTLNSVRVNYYPDYKELKINRYSWSRKENSTDVSIGYLNFKYISHMLKKASMVKEAKRWAKAHKGTIPTVFVYSMVGAFTAAAVAVKKIIPETKIVLIVPDLPQYMDFNMSFVKKVLKQMDWHNMQKEIKKIDKFILYSKHMAQFLQLPENSWTVMEGSYDSSLIIDEAVEKNDKISVMYSGVVDLRYGIPELLDAMDLLDERFELWITGGGNAEELIQQRAEKDKRIKFFGFLPSRKDLLVKQKQATMLISTRRPDEPASKYCFPSKLFEYMVSGNPVLSCRIGGIPDEYFDYLIEMESTSPQDIASAIKRVAEMTQQQQTELGQKGKNFVLDNKNNIKQAEIILKFAE